MDAMYAVVVNGAVRCIVEFGRINKKVARFRTEDATCKVAVHRATDADYAKRDAYEATLNGGKTLLESAVERADRPGAIVDVSNTDRIVIYEGSRHTTYFDADIIAHFRR